MFDYDGLTGYEPITETDRWAFQEQGFLVLRNVLSDEHRAALEAAVDRVYAEEADGGGTAPDGSLHLLGFVQRNDLFGELLTHPVTFPYVWGLAGWNIYSHHNHLDVHPPEQDPQPQRWTWHQDGYRQNSDPETLDHRVPRPMLSLKVAYVLSDLSEAGRGATKIVPGSHLWNSLERQETPDGTCPDPAGAVEITANPGDAFLFDRRLWHSRSANLSAITRKMLFVGYTYRWIRPLDEPALDRGSDWWADRTPVQRQLLGDACNSANYWGVTWRGAIDDEIPLRAELKGRDLLDRGIPWLR